MDPVIKMMRPINCLISSMSILIVRISLFGIDMESTEAFLLTAIGMAIVFFYTGGGNILNDYMDREVDKINHPERPIPSGEIRPRNALLLSAMLFSTATVMAFLLPFHWPQIIVVLAIILLAGYELSFKEKGFVGNISISVLTGMVFIFGGSIYGRFYLPIIMGVVAFLSSVGREIVKDIQDIKGDRDRNTFPMRVGKKIAKRTAAAFVIFAVILSPLPYILELLPLSYLLVVIAADIIFIYSLSLINVAERSQKFMKLAMVIALLAFLIGGIV